MHTDNEKPPLFYYRAADGKVHPLETRVVSITVAEDEAWAKHGPGGKMMIELEGELKEFR